MYSLNSYSKITKPVSHRMMMSLSFQYIVAPASVAQITTFSTITTHNFNLQLKNYLQVCQNQQDILLQRTRQYIKKTYTNIESPSISQLRDKNTWPAVKRLVAREELMKAQICGKLDISLPGIDTEEIMSLIKNKDLSNVDDTTIDAIIDKFIKIDDQSYLDALIQFKKTGVASNLLQKSKLIELSKVLQDTDLNHITRNQYKKLLENYCERPEYHHRESISSNPEKQSLADNIDILDTTTHDQKHVDSETGKINYRKPVNEKPLNRTGEMIEGNKLRVLKSEIQGLTAAAILGGGIGFAMSFIAEIAKVGLESEQIGNIIFNSVGIGVESGIISGTTYIAGRGLTTALENLGLNVVSNTGAIISFGAVGTLSTAIICTYQFIKTRIQGASAEEALSTSGKTAISSMSLLIISMIAQGIWGGPAGIIVSTGVGLFYFSINIIQNVHARKLEISLREYAVEEYRRFIG